MVEEGRIRRAGPFSYRTGRADIGALSHGGRELVRRLFVTVRDRNWREIGPIAWTIEPNGEDALVLEARHASDDVDFGWRGTFVVEKGAFRLSMFGSAHRDMALCRVGLVLLLPDQPLIGAHVRAEGPGGVEDTVLRAQIYPQAVVDDVPQAMFSAFRALQIDGANASFALEFDGDLFEMEDQRNWSDASFKVYCTPLAEGFPRLIKQGAIVEQSISGRLGRGSAHEDPASQAVSIESAESAASCAFPALGIMWSAIEAGPALPWARCRLSVEEVEAARADLAGEASKAACDLAVSASQISDPLFARSVEAIGDRLGTILLLDPASDGEIAAARHILASCGSRAQIRVATGGHFVEFNRGRPMPATADGCAFPLAPTAHLWDRWTIAENVTPIHDMARTARRLFEVEDVAISPLALFHPPAETNFPDDMVLPWFASMLCEGARAGITSMTLANDLVAALNKIPGGLDFLRRVMGWAGRPAMPLRMLSHPRLYGAVVRLETGRLDAVVVNLNTEPATLEGCSVLSGLPMVEFGQEASPVQVWRPGTWRLPPLSVLIAA